jgi:hypothetical protein
VPHTPSSRHLAVILRRAFCVPVLHREAALAPKDLSCRVPHTPASRHLAVILRRAFCVPVLHREAALAPKDLSCRVPHTPPSRVGTLNFSLPRNPKFQICNFPSAGCSMFVPVASGERGPIRIPIRITCHRKSSNGNIFPIDSYLTLWYTSLQTWRSPASYGTGSSHSTTLDPSGPKRNSPNLPDRPNRFSARQARMA